MIRTSLRSGRVLLGLAASLALLAGCGGSERAKITNIEQMATGEFAIPTGTVVEAGALRKFIESVSIRTLVLVDEAYIDLADDPEQHKHLHVVKFDAGHLGAFPNNRLLVEDLAFMQSVTNTKPDFIASNHEFFSE